MARTNIAERAHAVGMIRAGMNQAECNMRSAHCINMCNIYDELFQNHSIGSNCILRTRNTAIGPWP